MKPSIKQLRLNKDNACKAYNKACNDVKKARIQAELNKTFIKLNNARTRAHECNNAYQKAVEVYLTAMNHNSNNHSWIIINR